MIKTMVLFNLHVLTNKTKRNKQKKNNKNKNKNVFTSGLTHR